MILLNRYLLTKNACQQLFNKSTLPNHLFQWTYDNKDNNTHTHRLMLIDSDTDDVEQVYQELFSLLLAKICLQKLGDKYLPIIVVTADEHQKLQTIFEKLQQEVTFAVHILNDKNNEKMRDEIWQPEHEIGMIWVFYLQGIWAKPKVFQADDLELREFWYHYGLALQHWVSHAENAKCEDGLLGIRPEIMFDEIHVDEIKLKDDKVYLTIKNLPFCFSEINQTGEISRQGGLLAKENIKFSEKLIEKIKECQTQQQITNQEQENTMIKKIQNLIRNLSNMITLPLTSLPTHSYIRSHEQKTTNSYEIDNDILTIFIKTDHEIPQNQDDYQIFVHDTRLQEVDIVIKSQYEVEIVCELPIDFEQNRLKCHTGFDDNGKFTVIVTDVDIEDNT